MRIINLDDLKGGEILGKEICDTNGRPLLSDGIELTPYYVEKLKQIGVRAVYVEDEVSRDIEEEETISYETAELSKKSVKKLVDEFGISGSLDNEELVQSVNMIVDEMLSNKDVLLNVNQLRATNNTLHSHSVNVAIISIFVGIHMNYNKDRLRELAEGAILHDIGKVKIIKDTNLIKTMSKEDLVKYIEINHPKEGFDFLKKQNAFNDYVVSSVLMHHENVDGTGFPLGLKDKQIHENAKILSICNTFDNLIRGKGSGKPQPIYEILEYFIAMSNHRYDVSLVRKFSSNIAIYPSGTGVLLNTNEKAIVYKQNKSTLLRPVIKVIYDKNGEKYKNPREVDLSKEMTLFIIATCDI